MKTISPKTLLLQREGHVLRVFINRPEARNALNDEVMTELTDVLRAVENEADVRAVVISGSGDRAFCAGGDLKLDAQTFGFDHSHGNTVYADLLRTATHCTLPLIARVNGHCLAGGMGILTMCDLAVASTQARFGLPEVKVGLYPMQVGALLQRLIPSRKFAEMCMTGEPISAEEALQYGLVNYVVPPDALDDKVNWLVARVVDKSPSAIRRGKYAFRVMSEMNFSHALSYAESQIGTMVLTEDAREGLRAFNEKRAPKWTGR